MIVPYTTFMAYHSELDACEWRYLVLDEAHIIKNPELKVSRIISHKIKLTDNIFCFNWFLPLLM